MVPLHSVKLMINQNGHVTIVPASIPRGYAKSNPVVEVTGVPAGVSGDDVAAAYSRCIIQPIMHAAMPVPWHRIADAADGQIIRLRAGRPPLATGERGMRVNVYLKPSTLDRLAKMGPSVSAAIERLANAAEGDGNSDDADTP